MGERALWWAEPRARPEAGTPPETVRARAPRREQAPQEGERPPVERALEQAGEQRRPVVPDPPASNDRRISRPSHLAAATGTRRHSTRCMCSSFAGPSDRQVMKKRASAQTLSHQYRPRQRDAIVQICQM